jgi:hypothetical protein
MEATSYLVSSIGWFKMQPNIFTSLPEPNPLLSPLEVVKIQLDALQNNDLMRNNEGIRFAFQFASPINKKSLGDIETFIQLLKLSSYRAMIGFERALLDKMLIDGSNARQTVHLVHKDDTVSYLFVLSRQQDEPFQNCWMTDALLSQP